MDVNESRAPDGVGGGADRHSSSHACAFRRALHETSVESFWNLKGEGEEGL